MQFGSEQMSLDPFSILPSPSLSCHHWILFAMRAMHGCDGRILENLWHVCVCASEYYHIHLALLRRILYGQILMRVPFSRLFGSRLTRLPATYHFSFFHFSAPIVCRSFLGFFPSGPTPLGWDSHFRHCLLTNNYYASEYCIMEWSCTANSSNEAYLRAVFFYFFRSVLWRNLVQVDSVYFHYTCIVVLAHLPFGKPSAALFRMNGRKL